MLSRTKINKMLITATDNILVNSLFITFKYCFLGMAEKEFAKLKSSQSCLY